jgi:Outer membrane efflux protein
MHFFVWCGGRSLVGAAFIGAILGAAMLPVLAQTATSEPVAPAAVSLPAAVATPAAPSHPWLPAAYRNMPPDAVAGVTSDPALGDAELARLITLTRTYHAGRAQAVARASNVRRGFLGNDVEQRILDAELARLDLQLAEETAHALIDLRAATAKQDTTRALEALATQGLQLINQRLAAGLATHTDLERMTETAVKARAVTTRTQQERSAAAARLTALTGVQGGVPAGTFTYPLRSGTPADLLDRPDVRAARIRQETRDASSAELSAFYREAVLKALEETENGYAVAVSARAQRTAAADLTAAAARQVASLLAQLEAGRISRVQHVEAEMNLREAQMRAADADAAYFKALATLERALGR